MLSPKDAIYDRPLFGEVLKKEWLALIEQNEKEEEMKNEKEVEEKEKEEEEEVERKKANRESIAFSQAVRNLSAVKSGFEAIKVSPSSSSPFSCLFFSVRVSLAFVEMTSLIGPWRELEDSRRPHEGSRVSWY